MMAWDITIHKSQGLTLEKVVVELGVKDFSAGLSFHLGHIKIRHAEIFKICSTAGTPYVNYYYMEYWPKDIF
jgi:hypothetical protein